MDVVVVDVVGGVGVVFDVVDDFGFVIGDFGVD